MFIKFRWLTVFLSSMVLTNCALTDVNHLATTNWMDRHIVPDNKLASWAITPVLIPITIITLVVDNFIVAPTVHLPTALEDTSEFFTSDIDGYYANMGVLPFKVVLSPIVFVGSWLGRTVLASNTERDAAWTWPDWGRQWYRDAQGRLIDKPPPQEKSNVKKNSRRHNKVQAQKKDDPTKEADSNKTTKPGTDGTEPEKNQDNESIDNKKPIDSKDLRKTEKGSEVPEELRKLDENR